MFSSFPQCVTVLGGTGFLGRAVVQELARKGCRVRVPTRSPEKAELLQTAGFPGQICCVPCRLRTDAEAEETIGKADAIVNLIGMRRETKKCTFQHVHVEMAARIARVAKQTGARDLVHLSTLEAGVHAPSRYARSKALGEEAVTAFFSPAVLLRPSMLFGPGDRFFHWLAGIARFAPFVFAFGHGIAKRQPVYVGDVAKAVVRVLEDPACRGRVFELGGPAIYEHHDLLNMALASMGARRLVVPLPMPLVALLVRLVESFDFPYFSPDEIRRLQTNAVVSAMPANTFQGLGILPTSLPALLAAARGGFM